MTDKAKKLKMQDIINTCIRCNSYKKAALQLGIPYKDLVDRFIERGMWRYKRDKNI